MIGPVEVAEAVDLRMMRPVAKICQILEDNMTTLKNQMEECVVEGGGRQYRTQR
jgi:hypothetical protein